MAKEKAVGTVASCWHHLIENAADQRTAFLQSVEQHITAATLPAVECGYQTLTEKFVGESEREFLAATNKFYPDNPVYIGAIGYGTYLSVSWYYCAPHGYDSIREELLPPPLPKLPREEELRAFMSATYQCVQQAVKDLMEELGQDAAKTQVEMKKFLEKW